MSEPILTLIWLILQQHDKVSPDHCNNMRGVAMVSQKDLPVFVCMHAEGSSVGVCVDVGRGGGNHRELVPNVSVKLIRRK